MDDFDNGPVRRKRNNSRRGPFDPPPATKPAAQHKRGIGFFALEPRILYDAAAASGSRGG
jgi:hypothetical protein